MSTKNAPASFQDIPMFPKSGYQVDVEWTGLLRWIGRQVADEAHADEREERYGRRIADARFRDGQAAGAFEGARRLAERLGLIGDGEREFYKAEKK